LLFLRSSLENFPVKSIVIASVYSFFSKTFGRFA